MNFEFSVDFESQVIKIIVDNSITVEAWKEHHGAITYSRFSKLESEELQDKLKEICVILFTIDEI